jgi:hypothetical protein
VARTHCAGQRIYGTAFEDRLSVAFITGEQDGNRRENEIFMHPWFVDLKIRTKLWIVPGMEHEISPSKVQAEVYAWLKEDLKRRQDDAKSRPGLAAASGEAFAGADQAKRFFDTANEELKNPERIWRGVTLLQGVVNRWGPTEPGQQAKKLLGEIGKDEKYLEQIEKQGSADEIKSLTAQAKALGRFGRIAAAIEAWSILAGNYQGTATGRDATAQIDRLKKKK